MKLAGKVALQKSYQAHKFWYELLPPLKSYFSFTANWSKLKTGSRLVTTRYQGRNRFSTPQWFEVPLAFLGVGPIGFWLPLPLALFPVPGFFVAGLCSCLSSVSFSPLPWFLPPFLIFFYLYAGY